MTKIAHLSDIHFSGTPTRHKEYTIVLERTFEKLRELKPDLIVLTGDIVHTKTQNITPELIDKLVWMFTEFSSIADTHTILGNHDGIINNTERQDTISPIINAITQRASNTHKLVLHKNSEIVPIKNNMNLCIFSLFDKDNWQKVKDNTNPKDINVALFHGTVAGGLADNGMPLKSEIEVSFFKEQNYVMLGDLHSQQFLCERRDKNNVLKPWINYAGSLIQQNHGESVNKGFLVWDIRDKDDWDIETIEIKNDTPFLTVNWQEGGLEETFEDKEDINPGTRIRICILEDMSQAEKRKIAEDVKLKFNTNFVVFKQSQTGIKNLDVISTENLKLHKTSIRNDPESLIKLYEEYTQAPVIEDIKEQLLKYHKKLLDLELTEDSTRDVSWSIDSFEFENLFKYGLKNRINFSKLNGIVGIMGPNKVGKSACLGSLMYTLFNASDRGPLKTSYFINKRAKQCNASARIKIGNTFYTIKRGSIKADKRNGNIDEEKALNSLSLFKEEKAGELIEITNENADSKTDTEKTLRKLIGSSGDFLLTTFAAQNNITRFIDEGATQRKSIINRFLDLDVFEKLYKLVNDDLNLLTNKVTNYSTIGQETKIREAQDKIVTLKQELEEITVKLTETQVQIQESELWLSQQNNTINILNLQKEQKRLQESIAATVSSIKEMKEQQKSRQTQLEEVEKQLKEINVIELKEKQQKIIQLKQQLFELNKNKELETQTLEQQKKSIKKLDTVPCGINYPDCRFIKDSHIDKNLLPEQQKKVEFLLEEIKALKENIEELLKQNIETLLLTHSKLEKRGEELLGSIFNNRSILNFNEGNLEKLQEEFTKINEKLIQTEEVGDLNKIEIIRTQLKTNKNNVSLFEQKKGQLFLNIGKQTNILETLLEEKETNKQIYEKIAVLNAICQALSKNGIPALLLKTQIPIINNELEKLLSGFVDLKISINTEINSNVLDIFIEDDEEPKRIIELGSGYEKTIASLALRVVLTNLSSLPKTNMLILDEPTFACDEENMHKIFSFLQSLKSHFKTILIVTHIDSLKEIADTIITINKKNGFAQIDIP